MEKRVGAVLRKLRTKSGLTQGELGARLDPPRDQTQISRVESGSQSIRGKSLEQWLRIVGVSERAFYGMLGETESTEDQTVTQDATPTPGTHFELEITDDRMAPTIRAGEVGSFEAVNPEDLADGDIAALCLLGAKDYGVVSRRGDLIVLWHYGAVKPTIADVSSIAKAGRLQRVWREPGRERSWTPSTQRDGNWPT